MRQPDRIAEPIEPAAFLQLDNDASERHAVLAKILIRVASHATNR